MRAKPQAVGWTPSARQAAAFLAGLPTGNTTLNKADTHSLLMESGGIMLAQGRSYDIIARPIGAGVYKITLRISNP